MKNLYRITFTDNKNGGFNQKLVQAESIIDAIIFVQDNFGLVVNIEEVNDYNAN